ncbi:MAG: single-stranded DNA-binding protein, partial [Niameybacter sp.]
MNQVNLLGNLTQELVLKEGKDTKTPYVHFTLAVHDKKCKKEERTYFIEVVAFRKNAKILAEYANKGTALIVCGKIITDSYLNKEGEKVYSTRVLLEDFQFVGGAKKRTVEEVAAS